MTKCFVVNLTSAGGRTRQRWADLEPLLKSEMSDFVVKQTKAHLDATRLTEEALDEGATHVIAVGGDGTNNEVVNGFFHEDGSLRNPEAAFSFFPSGSGGDLRRSYPAPENAKEMLRMLMANQKTQVDVGRVSFVDGHQNPVTHYFLNIASFGISSLVVRYVNESKKPFGGSVAFAWHTLRALRRFQSPKLTITCDDGEPMEFRAPLVAIANGRFFGGGMMVAPDASMQDGLFDVIVLSDISKLEFLRHSSKIYAGKHIQLEKVKQFRASKVSIDCDKDDVWLELDGELPGLLPASIEVIPQALPCLTMPG